MPRRSNPGRRQPALFLAAAARAQDVSAFAGIWKGEREGKPYLVLAITDGTPPKITLATAQIHVGETAEINEVDGPVERQETVLESKIEAGKMRLVGESDFVKSFRLTRRARALLRRLACPLDILGEQAYAPPRMSTRDERVELLQGTLDMLILRTLVLGPAHGHAIAHAIERNSEDVLQVEQGSLYPALHRLIRRGWICAEDGVSENNRRAKFYRLTPKGRRQLAVENSRWDKFARAIARIMRSSEQEAES